jgi:catechol 2,3-dioxygenase-like lactoylglutathione lyase family enzyme
MRNKSLSAVLLHRVNEGQVMPVQVLSLAIEKGPILREGARGTLRSVYCRDPDGSLIEIASYEDSAS